MRQPRHHARSAQALLIAFVVSLPACGGGAGPAAPAAPVEDAPVTLPEDRMSDEPANEPGSGASSADSPRTAVDAGSSAPKTRIGSLAPEKIKSVFRASYATFRKCYAEGLRTNPSLAGRVAVKFVIGTDGRVLSAVDSASDLSDPSVVQCVVGKVRDLRFPRPEGAQITVLYPIVFSRGD